LTASGKSGTEYYQVSASVRDSQTPWKKNFGHFLEWYLIIIQNTSLRLMRIPRFHTEELSK